MTTSDGGATSTRPARVSTTAVTALDPVTMAVRFASLPDGVNYPAETVLVAQAKQIQVKITNSGYKK